MKQNNKQQLGMGPFIYVLRKHFFTFSGIFWAFFSYMY